ncbi:MAG: hypothetical protein KBS47_02170 [Bacteroidales bacterium]|nr:hypothetical protein [Candidatus Equimonas enterica]
MKTIEIHVHKDIAMKLQEAQIFHNLPIIIHVKPIIHGMVPMKFEYEEDDELLARWFTDTLIDKYARDL